MERRSEKLLKLASDLQNCLRDADMLDASLAAIKILEAHEAIQNLADEELNTCSTVVEMVYPQSSKLDTKL